MCATQPLQPAQRRGPLYDTKCNRISTLGSGDDSVNFYGEDHAVPICFTVFLPTPDNPIHQHRQVVRM